MCIVSFPEYGVITMPSARREYHLSAKDLEGIFKMSVPEQENEILSVLTVQEMYVPFPCIVLLFASYPFVARSRSMAEPLHLSRRT